MEIETQIAAERVATNRLFAVIESDFGELPVKVIAGALMRASVALAVEVLGPRRGQNAARRALDNILSQQRHIQ
jgi:hypothetical protein